MTDVNYNSGIRRAVKMAGSQKQLAEELGVSKQYINLAVRQGFIAPVRAQEIEAIYGISRYDLINPLLARTLNLSDCCCS
jgi:DNA-binding transcriptional regulator YdaS (Cro superfamily)